MIDYRYVTKRERDIINRKFVEEQLTYSNHDGFCIESEIHDEGDIYINFTFIKNKYVYSVALFSPLFYCFKDIKSRSLTNTNELAYLTSMKYLDICSSSCIPLVVNSHKLVLTIETVKTFIHKFDPVLNMTVEAKSIPFNTLNNFCIYDSACRIIGLDLKEARTWDGIYEQEYNID